MSVLFAIAFCHMLNDTIQSLISAIYPVVKETFHLNYTQVGLITLTFQMTASLLQPVVGFYTDRRPHPYSLAIGMCFTLCGLVLLSLAGSFPYLAGFSGFGGNGVIGLPSRSVANGVYGSRRPAWICPGGFSSRWKHRQFVGPAYGRDDRRRPQARKGEYCGFPQQR